MKNAGVLRFVRVSFASFSLREEFDGIDIKEVARNVIDVEINGSFLSGHQNTAD